MGKRCISNEISKEKKESLFNPLNLKRLQYAIIRDYSIVVTVLQLKLLTLPLLLYLVLTLVNAQWFFFNKGLFVSNDTLKYESNTFSLEIKI